jgi:hypothetical protein
MIKKSKKKQAKPKTPPKLEDVLANVPSSITATKLVTDIKGHPYKEVTIGDFAALMTADSKNRVAIAQFVYDRFHQRYLLPFEEVPRVANSGFAQMSVNCLMIETLESFRNGWNDTMEDATDAQGNKLYGSDIFNNFFTRYEAMKEFQGLGVEFYKSIRCGILHQAESKNGWRIVRTKGAPVLDPTNRIIHSTKFRRRIKKCLRAYCDELEIAAETGDTWQNFKTKMAYIILNCIPQPIRK